MNSSQEMILQTSFVQTQKLRHWELNPGSRSMMSEAGWNSDLLFYLGWFISLLSLHLLSLCGKWASRRYVTWILNKVNGNTLKKKKRHRVLASSGQICWGLRKNHEGQLKIPETDRHVLWKTDLHSRDLSSVDEEAFGAAALSRLGHCPRSHVPRMHVSHTKVASGS